MEQNWKDILIKILKGVYNWAKNSLPMVLRSAYSNGYISYELYSMIRQVIFSMPALA